MLMKNASINAVVVVDAVSPSLFRQANAVRENYCTAMA
jgi:hypothetical protein